jgi:S-adenosylmethionine/arginine decarboxylase-like enzyme
MNVPETSRPGAAPGFWGRWCGLDLSECLPELIADRHNVERYIMALCQELDFKPYGSPSIVRFGSRPQIAGITFTQMIETSLISGHLVEESGAAFIDIFSCIDFSAQHAEDITRRFFRPARCVRHLIDRFSH